MNRSPWLLALLVALSLGLPAPSARGEGLGQEDFDEALRAKVTVENMQDLNNVVELLKSAISKGLDVENNDLAEQMLVESLMQRGAQLAAVLQSAPANKLDDESLRRVRGLAVSDLRLALEYDNAPPQAKALLSQLLALPGGDPKEALQLLDDLFDDEGIEALPPKMRAESLSLRGKLQAESAPEKALADFNAAIELDPTNPEYRLTRADFYNNQQKYDEAIADIDAVIEQHPEAAGSYLVKSALYRQQGKYAEALATLDKAAELAPSAPGVAQQRGEIYSVQGEFPKAIEQFSKVLEMHPGLLLPLLYRAQAYLNDKQYDKALVDIEAVLKADPNLSDALGMKALTLASLERFPEAITELKKLTDQEPEQPEYQLQLALYYLYAKQPREAIAAYTDLLKEDADNYAALRGRADAYLNIGEHANAVADFKKAFEVEPKEAGLLNNYAWVLATSPDDDVRDGKLAIDLATQACEATQFEQSHILSTLAAAYAEAGDFEKAQEWSKKAIDVFEKQRAAEESPRGKEEADELAKELAEELASFQAQKPWRERQTMEEASPAAGAPVNEKPASEKLEGNESQASPAAANAR